MLPRWHEVPLTRTHDRKAFDCGEAALNEYLHRFARQNHESGGAKTFVAVRDDQPNLLLGYYTLSPASLEFSKVPAAVRKGLGRYEVPAFRLGRLAVSRNVQGQGLGGLLLLSAGRRCQRVAEEVGGVALLIDAKSDRAAIWYEAFGAVRLDDTPLSLVLPLKTIAAADS